MCLIMYGWIPTKASKYQQYKTQQKIQKTKQKHYCNHILQKKMRWLLNLASHFFVFFYFVLRKFAIYITIIKKLAWLIFQPKQWNWFVNMPIPHKIKWIVRSICKHFFIACVVCHCMHINIHWVFAVLKNSMYCFHFAIHIIRINFSIVNA